MSDIEPGFDDETANKIFDWIAAILGVQSWTPSEGSETWDGDVKGSLYRLLEAAGVWDAKNGELTITALRAEVESLKQQMDDSNKGAFAVVRQANITEKALRAENERLRVALEDTLNKPRDADKTYAELFVEVCCEIRAALEEKP